MVLAVSGAHLVVVGVIAIAVSVGVVAAGEGLYLVVLSAAAFVAPRRAAEAEPAWPRVTLLVPAHDEVALVARCVDSLLSQSYPRSRYEVVVIADNCTDDTAAVARRAGARVLVRDDPSLVGKGRALRWAMDLLLAADAPPEAIGVVDADSIADPGFLAGLVEEYRRGWPVIQGEYLALPDTSSTRAELRGAAFLLFHRVRFAGRAALGLPCSLVGNGMLFDAALLRAHPWDAFSSAEDVEFSVDLRLAGIRPRFAPGARISAPVSSAGRAARTQRLRWEGGRLHVVRSRLPGLLAAIVGRGRWDLVDAAVDLAVPPVGVLASVSVAGVAAVGGLAAVGDAPISAVAIWAAAAVMVPLHIVVGLIAAHAPPSTFRALVAAPAVVGAELATRARLLHGLRASTWERTERPGVGALAAPTFAEATTPTRGRDASRPEILGIPIDALDVDAAVQRCVDAVRDRTFLQVCTVNLDFLVNARHDAATRAVLSASGLNLPDGAPVGWLVRLAGRGGVHRVAGADLVPALASRAADERLRLFLLGGEGGVAQRAATALIRENPGLLIAGVYEPPRAPLGQMDDAGILERVARARADVLLVAFGHPKQERWIHDHADALPVPVAIGVGCTFDLLAGRRTRAPRWMQDHGLEWLYRAAHEPVRLGGRYLRDAGALVGVFVPAALHQRHRRQKVDAP